MPTDHEWPREQCPPWCVVDHEEADIDGDRDHQSEAVYVPVIRVVRHVSRYVSTREMVADEVVVNAFQAQGESRPNVAIAFVQDGHVRIELRDESVERLWEALRRVLEELSR